jgi:hypothetical protein
MYHYCRATDGILVALLSNQALASQEPYMYHCCGESDGILVALLSNQALASQEPYMYHCCGESDGILVALLSNRALASQEPYMYHYCRASDGILVALLSNQALASQEPYMYHYCRASDGILVALLSNQALASQEPHMYHCCGESDGILVALLSNQALALRENKAKRHNYARFFLFVFSLSLPFSLHPFLPFLSKGGVCPSGRDSDAIWRRCLSNRIMTLHETMLKCRTCVAVAHRDDGIAWLPCDRHRHAVREPHDGNYCFTKTDMRSQELRNNSN